MIDQAQLLGPGDQVLGELHQPQPHLVVGKGLEREVAQPAVLALADAILDPGVAAMIKIKLRDLVAWLVGDEHRQPVAIVVGERLLVALS